VKNPLKRKKTKMEYEKYSLEKLQEMFDVEQNPEELNKIMSAISDKYDVMSDDNEETNNVQLEEEIYQQMNLIKLRDFNALPLEENLIRNMVKQLPKMRLTKLEKKLIYMKQRLILLIMSSLKRKNLVNHLEETLIS